MEKEKSSHPDKSGPPPVIVLVEDEENSRFIFEAAVEYCAPRFHIEFFFDVQSCRDALQASQVVPTTILLDYNLGVETGLALLQWLRGPTSPAALRDLVVIMFSGNCADSIVENCYLAGADYYLTKPARFSHLCDVVRALDLCVAQGTPAFTLLEHLPNHVAKNFARTPPRLE